MPKLTPDRLPTELAPLLEEIRPPRRVKHMAMKRPTNLHDSLMQAALVCPRNVDLASFYWVDENTFREWRKNDPTIDVVIAQAKQADTAEVLQAVRKRAVEGSAPHAKIYLERMRPDLNEPHSAVNVNTSVKVTVLPTPPLSAAVIRKPSTIEGEIIPEREMKPKTPLFGGKEVGPNPGPIAQGKS